MFSNCRWYWLEWVLMNSWVGIRGIGMHFEDMVGQVWLRSYAWKSTESRNGTWGETTGKITLSHLANA
jgi:hypothetical protein